MTFLMNEDACSSRKTGMSVKEKTRQHGIVVGEYVGVMELLLNVCLQ